MSLSAMTVSSRMCRSCSRLFLNQVTCTLRKCAFSTSSRDFKDEDDMSALKINPYFGKYSKKISEMKLTTPEELTRRIAAFRGKKHGHQPAKQYLNKVPTSQQSFFTKGKCLDEIMKLDLLKDKTSQEIAEIWLEHHLSLKDTIAVVISSEVYNLILKTSSNNPTFLLPLPREHGYEFFVTQSNGNEFHFTPLINYQTFKENAPECLALTHFSELSEEKGIVMMQGDFNNEVLNTPEAICLTNQLHRYYGETDSKRQKLLERFTNAPTEFCHMDLIVELERMVQ